MVILKVTSPCELPAARALRAVPRAQLAQHGHLVLQQRSSVL